MSTTRPPQDPIDITEITIADVHAALREGRLTCRQLVAQYLERIDAFSRQGPKLNAYITLNPEALNEAEALDSEFSKTGELRPLHGIPVALKDSIDAAGLPTTGGSAILRDSIAATDAFLVSRLKAAGAIILGKNNMGDLSGASYSTMVGVPRNPYHLGRAPGGSSSGSGVSVAANLTLVAVGEDTLTSVRTPAAWTNVVGLRPTTGLISSRGIMPRKKGIDTAGPMARTVTDAARLLNALAGPDPADPLSQATFSRYPEDGRQEGRYGDFTRHLTPDALQGVRVGIGRDFFGGDPEIDGLANDAIQAFRGLGAELVEVRLDPAFFQRYVKDALHTLTPILMYPFREVFESYLATLGPTAPRTVEAWIALYENEVSASALPPETSRPPQALQVLKESLQHSRADSDYQTLLQETLPMLTREKRAVFQRHGIQALIMPYTPTFAEPIKTPLEEQIDPRFVLAPDKTPANSIAGYGSEGFPMVVVPMGFGTQGLPMGLAIMGEPYSDARILGYAYAYEQVSGHRRAPATAPSLPGPANGVRRHRT